MHVVYEAANPIDAHLLRHALEHVGIPVFIRGEALLGGIGELPACALVAVCVPESHWPEARALVEVWSLATDGTAAAALQPWPGGGVLA